MNQPQSPSSPISRDRVVLVLVAVLMLLVGYVYGSRGNSGGGEFVSGSESAVAAPSDATPTAGGDSPDQSEPNSQAGTTEASDSTADSQESAATTLVDTPIQFSNLNPIYPDELPDEALTVMGLIASDGPYPFGKDGSTFQNREGILPDFPRGHYREFTVITPGSSDRGARRIVAGDLGELYYTSDHYDSFREIVQ